MMTTVYVLALDWQEDAGTKYEIVGVFSTKDKAQERLAEYVNAQDLGWTDDLGTAWETMTSDERIAAYFDFWNEDGYCIEKHEVK